MNNKETSLDVDKINFKSQLIKWAPVIASLTAAVLLNMIKSYPDSSVYDFTKYTRLSLTVYDIARYSRIGLVMVNLILTSTSGVDALRFYKNEKNADVVIKLDNKYGLDDLKDRKIRENSIIKRKSAITNSIIYLLSTIPLLVDINY